MSNETVQSDQGKLPLWIVVLFISALVLMISVFGLSTYQQSQVEIPSQAEQTLLQLQEEQLLRNTDLINTNWLRTLNPLVKNVQGRLLWSSEEQLGIVTFNNLSKLAANQQYRLTIYDLDIKKNDGVTALLFKQKVSGRFEKSFKPDVEIKTPLKFELVLEEEGVDFGLPLLLAQP